MKDKIFLLSAEEAKKLPQKILESKHWWWLRSSGFVNTIVGVVNDNKIYPDSAKYVFECDGGVRPALRFDTHEEILNLPKTKTSYKYLGEKWTDITVYVGFPCLLKKKPFKKTRRFDSDSHDYEKSEIRQWLLNWYENKREKIDIINNKKEIKEEATVVLNNLKSDLVFTGNQMKILNTAIDPLNQDNDVFNINVEKQEMTMMIEKTETFVENNIIVGGTNVGSVTLCPEQKKMAVLTIFEPYQNKGYGTQVVKQLVSQGYKSLCVRSDNPRAIHVYEKCGFVRGEVQMFEMVVKEEEK